MQPVQAMERAARWSLLFLVLAGSANACPLCLRAEAENGGSAAWGFAVAGGLLLAGPFVLAGVFGLLLARSLASAGDASAVKESA
jgi:hypothetical protein